MTSKRTSQLNVLIIVFMLNSCSTIDSTLDTISDSVSSAGDYIFDSVNFWEDDEEPEQSDAIIVEEAVEVPDFALPDQEYLDQNQNIFGSEQSQMFQQPTSTPYYNPIYRSQRQYYYVGPNGTPLPAPPPPPFPQYSIDQQNTIPYSYTNNFGYPPQLNSPPPNFGVPGPMDNNQFSAPVPMTKDEEMELFGIQNNCIRVTEDFVNGGYMCDDFD